jgi:cell division protease FtsH
MVVERPKPGPASRTAVLIAVALAMALGYATLAKREVSTEASYSDLLREVREGRVKKVEIRTTQILADAAAEGEKPRRLRVTRLPKIDETELVADLEARGVEIAGRIDEESVLPVVFSGLLPFMLVLGAYYFIFRRVQKGMGGGAGPLSFGRNKAKIYDESHIIGTTFRDVAGIDEAVAEMREVVDFLKNPAKYRELGARIPKGVLLVGPPGTGKTLLAKAVAGESKVPFFSLSGSDFVEMFVGVGAARVRDLFSQAAERSPCIVFIDEIDAIGKSRGGIAAMGTHDEREQTLNQLLAEMDGFDPKVGIIIMAATNRPEVLDPALVRAGRFDRQVVVDRPSIDGRRAILLVHAMGVRLAHDVDLDVVAKRTPGMVGADLAKIVNEAALAAARDGATEVAQEHFEESVDRVQLGLEKSGRAMTDEEKRRVAYHESGHALVAMSLEHADPVHKITIIPRTIGALGATLQLPTEERYLMLADELRDRIAVMLGGRVAEEIALSTISTGAQNDLERATETARQMVCRFGMSERLGPVTFGRPMGARFLDSPVLLGEERNFSEETAKAIDEEVRRIVETERDRARAVLREKRHQLEAIVAELLERETLGSADLARVTAG